MSISTVVPVLIVGLAGALLGFLLSRRREAAGAGTAEDQAAQLLEQARRDAETIRRSAELEAKEALLEAKANAETQARDRLHELEEQRKRLLRREEDLERKEDQTREQEQSVKRQGQELGRREQAAELMARSASEALEKAQKRLEELASMTAEKAREQLIEHMRDEARRQAAAELLRIEAETEAEARQKSITLLASALQRYASEYSGERTVSVVQLPSDEMKGRIIGREGRNIRAIEAATGVDLIVDDTPEAVILSCFNPKRREIARVALGRLIVDGRIHPARVEEVVKRVGEEVDVESRKIAEQAVFDLGLHRIHAELVRLLGDLRFRSSYAQNLLEHSVEVAWLSGAIAAELGIGAKLAKRAGLLHDIGKAAPHETDGSHAAVGAVLAKKYGENDKVVHAIEAHHGEVAPESLLAHVVFVANQLSAQRPGARREKLESYIQRLHKLEDLCKVHAGVERAYAIQAGHEVRVMVENESISDESAVLLCKDIAKEVEDALTYPGQIKVCVIRESRASDLSH